MRYMSMKKQDVLRLLIEEYGREAVVNAMREFMHESEPFDEQPFNLMEVHCLLEYLEMRREQ